MEEFNLIKSSDQLEMSQLRAGNTKYRKIGANRDVVDTLTTNNKFSQGDIIFNWSLSSQTYMDPRKTYISIDTLLTDGTNSEALLSGEGIGYANGAAGNLFESATLYLNDIEVMRNEYCGEVHALGKRQSKSGYWLDNYGNSIESFGASLADRVAYSEANKGKTLALHLGSVFDSSKYLIAGRYRLVLTSSNQYKKRAVQSSVAKEPRATDGTANDYDLKVKSCDLYVNEITGPRMNDGDYLIDYSEIQLQPQQLSSSNTSSKTFTVPQSTYRITVANQEQAAGTTTVFPPSLYKCATDKQDGITSLLIQYSDMSYPDGGAVDASSINTIERRQKVYVDTQHACMNMDPESLENWSERGQYISARFLKDATDLSTLVRVDQTLSAGGANVQQLLFCEYSKVARVTIRNGVVVNVEVTNA